MSNMKHIDALDEKGIEVINTIIDTQIANGVSISDALVDFSYEPPAFDAPCEVKASKYGNGLFASRDIKKGEVVTLYPAHLHLSAPDKKGGREGKGGVDHDMAYCVEHVLTNTVHQGDKEKTDPLFLGHIVNDFCTFVEEFKDKKRHGETMMKYFIYAISFQNVEYDMGKHFVNIKASKDIKAGEEFLVAYSPAYWTKESVSGMTETIRVYINSVAKRDPKKGLFLAAKFKEYFERKM